MMFVFADEALPRDAQLRGAGHMTVASLETALPIVLFISSLIVLLPRTGNESRFAIFRFIGRFPLLIRYFAVVLPFFGIQASIEKFFE
jgi:hypothetical protein